MQVDGLDQMGISSFYRETRDPIWIITGNMDRGEAEMQRIFKDRHQAGKELADKLVEYADRPDVIILGLPRGGVPVAYEVAKHLHAPLDVLVVRKLGVPGQEELAFGAIASGGGRVLNENLVRALKLGDDVIERITARERIELERREELYGTSRLVNKVNDRTVIIVDDGLATGATMRAAVAAVRRLAPRSIVVAVPVGSADTCADIVNRADVICVCIGTPEPFFGVGMWYEDFSQTSDSEVSDLLATSGNAGETGAAA